MPTRKPPGTLDVEKRKRLCVASIASEAKRSEVVEEFAEGRGSFDDSAEWHLSTCTSPMRVGEVTNSSAKGSVYCRGHFSGAAGVAAAFIQLDREALDLDHIVDKNRVKGPVSKVDLCKKQNQQLVLQWLDEGKVDAAMLAPPCGTSSRAREIPIIDKKGWRRPAPRPLRSQNWPDGVPSLKGLDAMKVRLANSCIDLQGGSLTSVVSLEFHLSARIVSVHGCGRRRFFSRCLQSADFSAFTVACMVVAGLKELRFS